MLAFVLSGGGARGAYQAGALTALLEAGYRPQLLVGASVGALNAAFLALHGVECADAQSLCQVWRVAAETDILSGRSAWLAARAVFNRHDYRYYERMRRFLIEQGIDPGLRFGDLADVRLIVVATDLNHCGPALFGLSPEDNLLDALMASAALPPWIPPIVEGDRLLTDGGLISNLPIEAALDQGATEIIALDLDDWQGLDPDAHGFVALVSKIVSTAAQRQRHLEMALAESKGVPVRRIALRDESQVPVWDFSHADQLIAAGYRIARDAISQWPAPESAALPAAPAPDGASGWRRLLRRIRSVGT